MNRMVVHSLARQALSVVCGLSLLAQAGAGQSGPVGRKPAVAAVPGRADAEAQQFVDALIAKMTMEEKVGQMTQVAPPVQDTIGNDSVPEGATMEDRVRHGQVGSFLFVTDPKRINELQHLAVDESRLHIPLIFGFDVIHGFHTIFPVPLAMAASWDPKVAETAQGFAAREASAAGVNWTFAPMVDVARDGRWGRMVEGAGEDPFLGSAMAAAQVRGFQGPEVGTPNHIVACVKHFAAYGAAEGGRDYDAANVSDEQMWNVYLPPFHAAELAGAGTFMSAYQDVNGVPATGNRFLLHDVLRTDWGFKGFVVSDWQAVENLTTHGFAAGPEDAAARAANAGLDMEMTSTTYRHNLPQAIKDGLVSAATVDQAVRNVLTIKYKLGLFSHPYVEASQAMTPADLLAQREASRRAAEKTFVLLKNDGGLLPLKALVKKVAVVGPLADSPVDMAGPWSLAMPLVKSVSIVEGMRAQMPGVTVTYAEGVQIERNPPSMFQQFAAEPKVTLTTEAQKTAAFQQALAAIQSADVAVLVMGEQKDMSGEKASRASFSLPGDQEKLIEAAVATGKPVVLLVMNGRPLDITWASEHVPAIVETWYGGSEAGNAVADMLTGAANPGGKLPISWPRSAGQEPFYYSRNITMDPQEDATRYWDLSNTALYPFGYGLSYTSFKMGPVALDKAEMSTSGTLTASVQLTNTGKVAGEEVVQLYTHQRAGSMSRPRRELKGFAKVSLKPGETQTVRLAVPASELSFWSTQTRKASVEPGTFDVWVGTNSDATEHATFVVK